MANRPTTYIPSDPLFKDQWFLKNTGQINGALAGFDINVTKVWSDYTGKGVLVAAIDDGFDQSHPDLAANYRSNISWDLTTNRPGAWPVSQDDNHGTAVAGLVIGINGNNTGGTGVAWGANLVGYRSSLTTATLLNDFKSGATRILKDRADISTNSWGPMSVAFDAQGQQKDYVATAYQLALEGRGGLGVATLFAAGNDQNYAFNTNYDPTDNIPFAITVAASKANGLIANYSTPGASVLVTAPGSDPASIVTTDRQNVAGYNNIEGVNGDYTNTITSFFNGTSAATPIAAGVVALMLEANKKLGYRDIQEILVYSSKRGVFLNQDGVELTTNHSTDWNGGGLITGYSFGYGNIDALAAVRLAETWQKTGTINNLKIIDGSVQQHQMSVVAGSEASVKATFASDARIEQVTVTVNIDAQKLENVKLDLISPNGTHNLLIDNPPNNDTAGNPARLETHLYYTLNTVRNWGESAKGDWTLRLTNNASDNSVTLNDWSIKAYTADTNTINAQIFTDEFSSLAAISPNRLSISSAHGKELNASAITGNSTLDLSGGASSIGGTAITLSDPQSFVNIISGDGNDRLIGNSFDNLLMAGRGNNILDGGLGIDTAQYIGRRSMYGVELAGADNYKIVSNVLSGGGIDQLTNIEKLVFGTTSLVARSALDQTEAVGSMYDAMFNRGADAGGLKIWTNSILDGANSELSVARFFTQASEDNVSTLTNAQFVTRMYAYGLERAPDLVGYDFWLNALNTQQQDRGQVLLSFIDSQEFTNGRVDLVATQISALGNIWA